MTELKIVDGLKWVESNAGRFFRSGVANAYELLGHVFCDVLTDATASSTVQRAGEWWIIASRVDWMRHGKLSVPELFQRVVAAPELGPNSMRSEVLVAVFAAKVATSDGHEWTPIKGGHEAHLPDPSSLCPNGGRVLAFAM